MPDRVQTALHEGESRPATRTIMRIITLTKQRAICSLLILEQAMTDLLKNPIFLDETKARDWLEARVWAKGRVCPHCGNADQDKLTKLEGKAHRPGVYQCNEAACREQFTVTVNTVFERSKITLTKWLSGRVLR